MRSAWAATSEKNTEGVFGGRIRSGAVLGGMEGRAKPRSHSHLLLSRACRITPAHSRPFTHARLRRAPTRTHALGLARARICSDLRPRSRQMQARSHADPLALGLARAQTDHAPDPRTHGHRDAAGAPPANSKRGNPRGYGAGSFAKRVSVTPFSSLFAGIRHGICEPLRIVNRTGAERLGSMSTKYPSLAQLWTIDVLQRKKNAGKNNT